jgi:hypothetical protein
MVGNGIRVRVRVSVRVRDSVRVRVRVRVSARASARARVSTFSVRRSWMDFWLGRPFCFLLFELQ